MTGLAPRLLGVCLPLAAAGLAGGLLIAAPAAPAQAQSCVTIGGSIFCGARGSSNTVGRTVIFNQGRPGVTLGDLLQVDENGRPRIDRVLPKQQPRVSGGTPPSRPPGSYVDLRRGRDFGARGIPPRAHFGGLRPSTGRLTPSGPNR